MRLLLRRPAIPEQADRDEDRARDHQRDAKLRPAHAAVARFEGRVDAVLQRGADLGAEEEAAAQREVVEAADADGFVVDGLPELREGGEDEVHEAVEVGHVEGEDLDDDLRAEELEGPAQADLESAEDGAVRMVVFGAEAFVACFFDHF